MNRKKLIFVFLFYLNTEITVENIIMKVSKERREKLKKSLDEGFAKKGINIGGKMFYPEFTELGEIYTPEECKKLGILR